MAGWSLAPSLMVIVAVLAHGWRWALSTHGCKRLLRAHRHKIPFALADQLTAMADGLLWGNGGEMNAQIVGPAAFTVDAQPSTTGGVVSSLRNRHRFQRPKLLCR